MSVLPRQPHGRWRSVAYALAGVLMLAACSTGSSSSASASCNLPYDSSILDPRTIPADLNPASAKPPIAQMTIRSGDLGADQSVPPQWYDTLKITAAQVNQVCGKHLKAVFLDWDSVLYNQIIRSGMRLALSAMGIDLIRVTSFSFDPNGLAGDLQAVLPLHPDIIFTGGTIDPNQFAAIMAPAQQAGIRIISWAVGPKGWQIGHGKQLVTMVGYDFYQLGQQMAVAVHNQYPNGTTIGYVHWVNNIAAIHLREQGLLDGLKKYSNITVVADGGPADPKGSNSGFNDPNNAQAATAAFLVRHPEVTVLFAPWEDPPGLGEEAAIKSTGNEGKVHIITMDLGLAGAPEIAHGGTTTIDMAQDIFDGGRSMAIAAALDELNVKVPPFIIFPTFAASKDNLKNAWNFMHGPEFPLPATAS